MLLSEKINLHCSLDAPFTSEQSNLAFIWLDLWFILKSGGCQQNKVEARIPSLFFPSLARPQAQWPFSTSALGICCSLFQGSPFFKYLPGSFSHLLCDLFTVVTPLPASPLPLLRFISLLTITSPTSTLMTCSVYCLSPPNRKLAPQRLGFLSALFTDVFQVLRTMPDT